MTANQNLETLIRQHETLKAENERLRQGLTELAEYAHGMIWSANNYPVGGDEFEALERRIIELAKQPPAAEVEAIAPKYAVGDKVRVKVDFERGNYRAGEYEVITAIRDFVPKPLDDARCIKLAFPCNDRFDDNEDWEWRADELIPYTDTD